SGVVAFDPAKAKALLDSLGWTLQGQKRAKGGKTLEASLLIPAGVPVGKSEAELIQNMLQQIGVTVDINAVPTDVFFPKYVTPGKFDMVVFSWLGTQFPVGSSQSIYAMPKGDDIQQNYARIGTPEIDRLYAAAIAELDPVKARETANAIDKLIWTQ